VGLLELAWRAAPADIDEAHYLLPDPFVSALNVAIAKARAVDASSDELIVAADTLVVADGEVLGKPTDPDRARAMLRQLRGRPHQVLTGVALQAAPQKQWGAVVSTRVIMRDYADGEIEAYLERGEPFDKAGAYAIQDSVFQPVEEVDGCYLNVVGLPLCAVAAGLAALGVRAWTKTPPEMLPPCAYCRTGEALVSVRSRY
jgi:MAF protein